MLKIKITTFLISLCMLTSVAFAHYDMSTPVEGASIANDALQFEVMKKMYTTLSIYNPSCFDYSIKTTQVLHYPYDVKKKKGKYVKGYWKELWTVNVCSTRIQVPVTFYIKGKKTKIEIDDSFLSP